MLFKLNPNSGEPLYLQLVQRIRHAAESGVLQHGDKLPSIRALAEELVVSPNTVIKAYSELEHEGLLEVRQGAGAFLTLGRRARAVLDHMESATRRTGELIFELREEGLRDDEIRRIFEAALMSAADAVRKR
jgi:GntR family transcriptional regulator